MRQLPLLVMMSVFLMACGTTRLAFSPDQCTAPTEREAQITKSVWK